MTYPNLIFINNVLDKYIEGRVKKTSPDNLPGLAINLFTTVMGKANNVSDVTQKFSVISLACSDAFLKNTEQEMVEAWVDIAISLGKNAFILDQHHSQEILHMLRSYIILCAETWPALNLAFAKRAQTLAVEQMRLRKVILKTEKALGITPQDDEDELSDEEIEQKADENEAKKTADELAKESKKTPAELRAERDEIRRCLVYIGKTESIADNKELLKQLFPQLSVAGKFKKLKHFKIIPTIPLVLHPNYHIVYSEEFFSKTLQEQIMECDKAHGYKYNQMPAFLQNQPVHQSGFNLSQQGAGSGDLPPISSSSSSSSSATILHSVSRQTSKSPSQPSNPPTPSPLTLALYSSSEVHQPYLRAYAGNNGSPQIHMLKSNGPESDAANQEEFSPSATKHIQGEQDNFFDQEQNGNDGSENNFINADGNKNVRTITTNPSATGMLTAPFSTLTAEAKQGLHLTSSNDHARQAGINFSLGNSSEAKIDGAAQSNPPRQSLVLTSSSTGPGVNGIFATTPAPVTPPPQAQQATNKKNRQGKGNR